MARAYRPRRDTTTPVERLRLIVDEHLDDAEADGRPPARPLWDDLTEPRQRAVVEAAASDRALPAWQGWIIGQPQDEADQLVGAVRNTLLGHAGHLITEQPA